MLQKVFRILQIVVAGAAVIFFVWFVAPFKYGIFNPGTILGCIICLYFIFRFIFYRTYFFARAMFFKRKVTSFIWHFLGVLKYVFLVYAVVISGLMVLSSLNAPSHTCDNTVIVLGTEVKPWGASELLQQRIDAAEKYLKENPDAKAVLSGGKSSEEPMSEAKCIYDSLVKSGIKPSRLYMEDKSTNTYENITFSYKIIKEKKLNENITIITDSYHQFRARTIAQNNGFDGDVRAVNAKNNSVGLLCYPTMFVREWIAIPAELIK